jgi:hypothetical protein
LSVQEIVFLLEYSNCGWRSILAGFARFFLTQYTKTGKYIPNYHLITNWP